MTRIMLFTHFGKVEILQHRKPSFTCALNDSQNSLEHSSPVVYGSPVHNTGHMTNTACIHNACDPQRVHSTTEADRGFASKMRLLVGNRACIETTFLLFQSHDTHVAPSHMGRVRQGSFQRVFVQNSMLCTKFERCNQSQLAPANYPLRRPLVIVNRTEH